MIVRASKQDNVDALVAIVGEAYRDEITGSAFTNRKDLFRDRTWKCHGIADVNESAEEVMESGRCGCTDLNLEEVRCIAVRGSDGGCSIAAAVFFRKEAKVARFESDSTAR